MGGVFWHIGQIALCVLVAIGVFNAVRTFD